MLPPGYTTLSLDIATKTGWAVATESVIVASGTVDLDPPYSQDYAKLKRMAMRLVTFENWLESVIQFGCDQIIFEQPVMNPQHVVSGICFQKLFGVLQLVTERTDPRIKFHSMHPNTLKLQLTGDGRASKEEMCRYLHLMGWKGGEPGTDLDDDEADACALIITHFRKKNINVTFGEE